MRRYNIIYEKNPREIVLLRGCGCKWRRCAFCDYHTDSSENEKENYEINREALSHVTGIFERIEIINSGSFAELDKATTREIVNTIKNCCIKTAHFESHWMYRRMLHDFSTLINSCGAEAVYKIGVETFDIDFREKILQKGMGDITAAEIAEAGFSEINLLFGIDGQNESSMKRDIETGLTYFKRICINIMTPCTAFVKPSDTVIKEFISKIYPLYKNEQRIDILLSNTDFGVG